MCSYRVTLFKSHPGGWLFCFNGNVNAEIANVLGQVIYTEQLTATNGSIQTLLQPRNLAAGSYMVRLNSDAGRIVLKFTVKD